MKNVKDFWESLNPNVKKYIKSFLKKMAIMLDVVFIFIGLNNSIDVYMSDGHWIFYSLWLLFMLIFIAIAIVYLENQDYW